MAIRNPDEAERMLARARNAARITVAKQLGRQTASGNLAADRIADAVIKAVGYRDPSKWPTRREMRHALAFTDERSREETLLQFAMFMQARDARPNGEFTGVTWNMLAPLGGQAEYLRDAEAYLSAIEMLGYTPNDEKGGQ